MIAVNHRKGTVSRTLAACILILVGLYCSPAMANQQTTVQKKFHAANHAYADGNYAEAARGYEELIRIVGPSADLYYNLGCTALKEGRLGIAVANYHRAARLAPRDRDIKANLEFVKTITSVEKEEEESFIIGAVSRWIFLLSDSEVAVLQLAFLLWFAAGATVLAAGLRIVRLRHTVLLVTAAGLFLLILNSTILGIHLYCHRYVHESVVIKANAEARSGPGEDNTRVLVLPEGTLVRIGESRGGWVLVSLPSGRSGWLKTGTLEEI
ncbi:MAG: SH3 domain-containing protein [Gemmatimonadota bacterium]|nr:SH3 domain-containing protein [Gemmatimonadota bacterium]